MPCDGAWPADQVDVFKRWAGLGQGRVERKELRTCRGAIDILNPDKPKRVIVLASNPAVSEQTGWPIGFWWSELTHPYWEFVEHGYQVDLASPDGGPSRLTPGRIRATRAATRPTTSSRSASSTRPST